MNAVLVQVFFDGDDSDAEQRSNLAAELERMKADRLIVEYSIDEPLPIPSTEGRGA